MSHKGYSCSVLGSREINQDSCLVNDEKGLYAVADGVGGGLKGEVASKMAVEGLDREVSSAQAPMGPAFHKLQAEILKEALDQFGEALMGTTLTAVAIEGYTLSLCHAGDSRCYLFDGSALRQLTEDHEFYDEVVQGTVLGSYLGIPSDLHPLKVLEEKFTLSPGQKLLLCSDGLYRQVTESRIVAAIRELGHEPENLVRTLCDEAATHHHSDNVTLVYVEIT